MDKTTYNVTWIRAIPLLFPLLFTLSSLTQILLSSKTSYSPIFLNIYSLSPLPSFSLCSASVLLWGIHRVGILQRHRVSDGFWRPLSEVDWVSRLCHAVPRPRAGWPQLLQKPRPRVQPLVFLQTKLWSHRMGLLRLSPGYDNGSPGCGGSGIIYNNNNPFLHHKVELGLQQMIIAIIVNLLTSSTIT